jgi:hypothetical protein
LEISNGGFVITWHGKGADDDYAILAQQYDSSATKVGGEFRVNSATTNFQLNPHVKPFSNGGYVVAWNSSFQDGSLAGIYAQLYDNAGTKVGSEFKVNTHNTENQIYARIAVFANNKFMITWQSENQDGSDYGVYAQRYLANGTADGSEFKINDYTTGEQWHGDIAAFDNNQGYVVTYTSEGGLVNDNDMKGIIAQRFSSSNVAIATGTNINTAPTETTFTEIITGTATIDFSSNVSDAESIDADLKIKLTA